MTRTTFGCALVALLLIPVQTTSEEPVAPARPPAIITVPGSLEKSRYEGTEPEDILCQFLMAVFEGNEKRIRELMVPNADADYLWKGGGFPPAEAMPQLRKQFADTPWKRLAIGDKVKIPGGGVLVLDEGHVNPDRQQICGDDGPLPYILARIDGKWRVDASPIIAARKTAMRLKLRGQDPAKVPSPDWTAIAEASKGLAKREKLSAYTMRPPEHYKMSHLDPAKTPTGWSLPTREDGTAANLFVIAGGIDPGDSRKTLQGLLEENLELIERRRENWKCSPIERGKIHDMTFVRARHSGNVVSSRKELHGKVMHGVVYIAADNEIIIIAMASDIEPHQSETLKAMDAAIRTIQRAKDSADE